MARNTTKAGMMMALGGLLRCCAHSIAWPANFSYSGPRESTIWAIREAALSDLGMGLFYLGGILFVCSLLLNQYETTLKKCGGEKADKA